MAKGSRKKKKHRNTETDTRRQKHGDRKTETETRRQKHGDRNTETQTVRHTARYVIEEIKFFLLSFA